MAICGSKTVKTKEFEYHSSFYLIMAFSLAAIAMSSVARAQAQESADTKPLEIRIVSSEFRFTPPKVKVLAGRSVAIVLDNTGGETEHEVFFPASGFRLQAKPGETVRKITVFEKPGQYTFACDLPGHREAGMAGTLIVSDSLAKN
jgi:uncharacterized cupredoxin-like copper-binding protein